MKKLLILLALLLSAAVPAGEKLPGQGRNWVPGPNADWLVHYDAAVKKAAAEKKLIFVLSTGSDWCPWCVRLHDGVLSRPAFRQLASERLILLYLDLPRRKKLPAAQARHNAAVRQLLKLDGGYPTAVIIDSTGRVYGKKSGYSEETEYLKFIRMALSQAETAER